MAGCCRSRAGSVRPAAPSQGQHVGRTDASSWAIRQAHACHQWDREQQERDFISYGFWIHLHTMLQKWQKGEFFHKYSHFLTLPGKSHPRGSWNERWYSCISQPLHWKVQGPVPQTFLHMHSLSHASSLTGLKGNTLHKYSDAHTSVYRIQD